MESDGEVDDGQMESGGSKGKIKLGGWASGCEQLGIGKLTVHTTGL